MILEDTKLPAAIARTVDTSIPPIERLVPGSKHHEWVLEQLTRRLKASEEEMKKAHPRWRVAERKFQAYASLPKYEQVLKDMNDSGKIPAPAVIVFPYKYAVISTIITYLSRVFCGRKPIFQLGITSPESAANVRKMETVLQYHADYTQLVLRLFQHFLDGELYGVAAMKTLWVEDFANRTTWRKPTKAEGLMGGGSNQMVQVRGQKRIYQGNEVSNVDPFMLLPDPSVPIAACPRQGEFLFAREFVSKLELITEQLKGNLKHIEHAEPMTAGRDTSWHDLSNRNLLSNGSAHAGNQVKSRRTLENIFMMDQGSINIIPADWGLGVDGEPEGPQKFLFALLNRKTIVQADALDYDHDSHPFVISEPYTMGYGFGSPSISEWLGPIQDIMSWFIDSHIFNVRSALNNMFAVDPSRVEIADLKRPGPGKIIRLKPTAIGQDVRSAIFQFPVQDVTRSHMSDLQIFQRIGDTVSAVSDNVRGVQPTTGRKSATESRITTEAASARLSSHAQMYSAQGISNLARQMCLNIQQYQDEELYLKVLGMEGGMEMIQPQSLGGEFTYPIHDGVMPLDKLATLEVWKELFMAVQADPELRQSYSLPRIFEYTAELGGAVNITSMRIAPNPESMPGMVPLNELPPPTGGPAGGGGSQPLPGRPTVAGPGLPARMPIPAPQ